jgi:hypothetical protein
MTYMSLPLYSTYATENNGSIKDTVFYSLLVKVSDPEDTEQLVNL